MPQEMFNDAMFFAEMAEANKDRVFVCWRYIRAATLFAYCAVESLINKFIDAEVARQKDLPEDERVEKPVLDILGEKNRFLSLKTKLILATKILTGKTFDIDKDPWSSFGTLERARHAITHYKGEREHAYPKPEDMIRAARNSVEASRKMLIGVCELFGPKCPPLYDQNESREM
jgi:hypothetical protein